MQRRRFLAAATGLTGASLLTGDTVATGGRVTHAEFEPSGSVDVPGAKEAVVHHDGDVAYVATGDGFAAVDIADPGDPTVISERRRIETDADELLGGIWDLRPSGDRLVVAGPANEPAAVSGFALFDISDPTQPEQVAFYPTEYAIHNCYFEDDTVYLTGSAAADRALVMVDVTADTPEEIGRWSLADADSANEAIPGLMQPLHDVSVQDGVAYLPYWDAGTWIVDVSEPADPSVLSRVGDFDLAQLREFAERSPVIETATTPGNAHYAQVNDDGTILAVGKEAWTVEGTDGPIGGAGGVDIYDVSEKTDPSHLAHIEPPPSYSQRRSGWFTTAHNLDIAGDRLYTSWYFGGVKIHDISDPGNPTVAAWWRKPREASFWTARSAGDVFVASRLDASFIANSVPNTTREALYVFPDIAGRQHEPPSLEQPPGTANDPAGNAANSTDAAADDGGAGFGAGAALAGAGTLSYLLARGRGSDEQ